MSRDRRVRGSRPQFVGGRLPFMVAVRALWYKRDVPSSSGKLLIRLARDRVRVIDIADVYYLEAEGELTLVRTRRARRLRDVRRMGDMLEALAGTRFLRIHRNHAVNLDRIREIRRRTPGGDWEVKLEPPVNRVLPVSRNASDRLWAALTARH